MSSFASGLRAAFSRFFYRRWQHDLAKAYLVMGAPCMLLSIFWYNASFEPPPESKWETVYGRLTVKNPASSRTEGSVIVVTQPDGRSHTFTCDIGQKLFCPPPTYGKGKEIASAAGAIAKFSEERPDLLLSLSVDGREVIESGRLRDSYKFSGFNRWGTAVSLVLIALFVFYPYIHRKSYSKPIQ